MAQKRQTSVRTVLVIFFAFGAALGLIGFVQATRTEETFRGAPTAAGTVVSLDKRGVKTTSYYVRYRFTPAGDAALEVSGQVNEGTWRRLRPGGAVTIEYLPGSPRDSRVANGSDGPISPLVFTLVCAAVVAVAGKPMLERAFERQAARGLRARGTPARGEVFDIDLVDDAPCERLGALATLARARRLGKPPDVGPFWLVRYRFEALDGRRYVGESQPLTDEQVIRWREGDVGELRYDPSRPNFTVWLDRKADLGGARPGRGASTG